MQLKNEDNTEEKVSHKVTWVPYIDLSRKWSVAKDQEEEVENEHFSLKQQRKLSFSKI